MRRRPPTRGAWIETWMPQALGQRVRVAPPRGGRGLKLILLAVRFAFRRVAPPRGGRGLKRERYAGYGKVCESPPHAGGVD